ncbi:hypothetical protein MLD38_004499 [Melastoma candidum]|uniref:Uncharacterized protein n=1 Tax=Melastoma candidum TaxID=119954 RepID=A0ACB9S5S8_9MYRT|nr:hypothetical protein MLD38_004499 [Melastoma candidum]
MAELRVGLEGPLAVEGEDVGVHAEGDDGAGSVGELLRDEDAGAAVLEEEEHEGVPDDALEDDDLDHEGARVVTIHAAEQGDAHDEGVGEGGEGEEGDGPVEGAAGAGTRPEGEGGEDEELLEGVGGEEAEVHGVRVVGGDEVEGEEGDGEEGDEAVDAGALVGGEDAPPLDGAVGEDHGHVERHHRRHYVVEIRPADHPSSSLLFSSPDLPPR